MLGEVYTVLAMETTVSAEYPINVVVRPPMSLRFRVIDEVGSPIEGASIWWEVDGEQGVQPSGEKFVLTTDADGWADISVPILRTWRNFLSNPCVVAEAPYFAAQCVIIGYEPDSPNEFVITLKGARTLEGRLLNSAGAPLIDQAFELELDEEENWWDRPVIVDSLRGKLVTDHAGRFKIAKFPSGKHQALLRAVGFHEREFQANADEFAEFRLIRKSNTVLRFLDADGNPLPMGPYTIWRVSSDGSRTRVSGGTQQLVHEYPLSAYPPGMYLFEAVPAGWSSSVSVQVEVTEEDLVQEFRATAPVGTCTLSGRVVGPDDVPVRATISLLTAGGDSVAAVLSSTDGSFFFGSVPMGEYVLWASKGSLKAAPIPVSLPRSEPLEIHLRAPATLLIRLPADKDSGFRSHRWSACVFDGNDVEHQTQGWHNATPGLYRLTGLTPGKIRVVVTSTQFCLWKYFTDDPWQKTLQVESGETAEVVFESLPAHSVRLRIFGPDHLPLANESLDLKRVSPTEPAPVNRHETLPAVVTDNNGELLTTWLLPGRYFFNGPGNTRVFFQVDDRPDQLIEIRVPATSGD